MTDTTIVAVASGVDPAEVRRLVERIAQVESMMQEQAEQHTAERETARQEFALIVADKDALIERLTERAEFAERKVRTYELAEAQTEGE